MWGAPGTWGGTTSDHVTGLSEVSPGRIRVGAPEWAAQRLPAQALLSPQPPRPCEAYRAEWKLCRSARHFLHHYYVHGERPACEQWRRDLDSCREWEERRSAEAQVRPGRRGWVRWGALSRLGAWPGRRGAPATLAPVPDPGMLEITAEGLPLFVLLFLSINTKN